MQTRCQCCKHPDRAEINRLLQVGIPYPQITQRFGVSRQSLSRHVNNCLGGNRGTVLTPLSGDVEIINEMAWSDDPVTLMENLTKATVDAFNRMQRRGDDILAAAYGRDIRANVSVLHELRKDRASRPPEEISPTRLRLAKEAVKRNEEIAQAINSNEKVTDILINLKERLEAKKAQREAAAPVIDLEATPHATPVENRPPSPVRTRTRPNIAQKK